MAKSGDGNTRENFTARDNAIEAVLRSLDEGAQTSNQSSQNQAAQSPYVPMSQLPIGEEDREALRRAIAPMVGVKG